MFFHPRCPVLSRGWEEILAERGVRVDIVTLNRWIAEYAPLVASKACRRKQSRDLFWRMDETHVKVKGEWCLFATRSTNTTRRWISCSRSAETKQRQRRHVLGRTFDWSGENGRFRALRRSGKALCHGGDQGCFGFEWHHEPRSGLVRRLTLILRSGIGLSRQAYRLDCCAAVVRPSGRHPAKRLSRRSAVASFGNNYWGSS